MSKTADQATEKAEETRTELMRDSLIVAVQRVNEFVAATADSLYDTHLEMIRAVVLGREVVYYNPDGSGNLCRGDVENVVFEVCDTDSPDREIVFYINGGDPEQEVLDRAVVLSIVEWV